MIYHGSDQSGLEKSRRAVHHMDKSIELYQTGGDLYNAKYCMERFPQLEERIRDAFRERYGIEL